MASLAAALLGVILPSQPTRAAGLTEVTDFGTNPGNLRMFTYLPDDLPAGAPLVVALHGCTQSAAAYDDEPGWIELADRWRFALLLPEQKTANDGASCFQWWEIGDTSRGQGEVLSIRQMVDRAIADQGLDPSRVFVAGLSAGGAMTSALLATYPEVFAAGAVAAGLPYRCATSTTQAYSCMNPGRDLAPDQWGDLVRAASSHTGPWPRVSVWHGTDDTTVTPVNMLELVEQWTDVHGTDQVPDTEDTVAGYPHKVYRDGQGQAVVESYSLTDMGHGQAVDPGSGSEQCGVPAAYILDVDTCMAYHVGRFFGLDHSDSEPPVASITTPTGGTVSGTVAIEAEATDDVGVARVEFFVDGHLVDSDAEAPYATPWDTTREANGEHHLHVRAVDSAGNAATSEAVTVTVADGVEDVTPPSVELTFPEDGDTVHGTITLSASASDDVAVDTVEFLVDGTSIGSGSAAGPAGPWTLAWNTTSVADGDHVLAARATDSSGNSAATQDVTVIVDRAALTLDESFSDRDGDGDHFDVTGWTSEWQPHEDNHDLEPTTSGSSHGHATSGARCSTGLRTRALSRSVTLGPEPVLTYARRLDLRAAVNLSTTAGFVVRVGSETVEEASVTYADHVEADWTERSVDLSAFARQTVPLTFEVSANSNVCIEVSAQAWIDDIAIGDAGAAEDTTAPEIDLVSPQDGATVSGTVDVTATATDDDGVAKVEFYLDGALIGTDTASPHEVTWDTTGVPDGDHAVMARAYDAAGNMAGDEVVVAVANDGSTTMSVVLANDDAEDGYVKAAADGSDATVGAYESTYGLAVGRGSDGRHNRTVLSFDTSGIPDTATITRAYLRLTLNSSHGDPWADPDGNRLVVDVVSGCFGACTIESNDWAASPDVADVADVARWTSGATSSRDLSAAGLGAINRTGTTQMRLRFDLEPTATAYAFLGRGADAALHVDYLP